MDDGRVANPKRFCTAILSATSPAGQASASPHAVNMKISIVQGPTPQMLRRSPRNVAKFSKSILALAQAWKHFAFARDRPKVTNSVCEISKIACGDISPNRVFTRTQIAAAAFKDKNCSVTMRSRLSKLFGTRRSEGAGPTGLKQAQTLAPQRLTPGLPASDLLVF